jgi:hypothetical protein
MAMRIPLRPFADVLVIDDPVQMAALNDHANVSRHISADGGGLHPLVRAWIYGTFSADGRPLAVVTARGDAARATRQVALERRLKHIDPDRDGVTALARYVAGATPGDEVGVVAQQVVGRLFDETYTATAASYRAAQELFTLSPRHLLTGLLRGRRAANRALLWSKAGGDLECLHATGVAIHGVVATLKRMRKRAHERGGSQGIEADAAIVHALVTPSMLFRSCTEDTTVAFLREPLRRGTLIVFRLRAMYKAAAATDLGFSRSQWSQCPAHEAVPRLLMAVWDEAKLVARYGPRRRSVLARALTGGFSLLNRVVPWHRLPTWLGVLNLLALRILLREKNLHDTATPVSRGRCPVTGWLPQYRHTRTADGTYNDLAEPLMGAARTRFGRAVPLASAVPDTDALLTPSPREISNRLLARRDGRMIEATSLNLLAAAWVQFEVHDWFSHGKPDDKKPYTVPLDAADPWPRPPMQIGSSRVDPDPTGPTPAHLNEVTHWWDASQLYGSRADEERQVRAHRHGKLAIHANGQLPDAPETGLPVTGFNDNWWIGLALLHTVFTLEHNAICDRLRAEQPGWDDDQLFGTARLINAALIAKIHTVEWTPAMLGHPALEIGMRGNWWGLAGERIHRLFGRISANEVISGIPGSAVDHHTAPYAMPEEFISVYRMHPLIPDTLVFRSAATGAVRGGHTLLEVTGAGARAVLDAMPMEDVFYSFGRAHPGQITLGNYPESLRAFQRMDGALIDVATIDVLRDRERGVPRYNAFRELFRIPRIRSFDELNPAWAAELRAVYGQTDGRDNVDRLDLMVGMFAETPPKGFAFSDTAFRILILMASRRLKSDRFFTTDYTADVYTQAGLDWIAGNDLKSVLTRHYPALRPALAGVKNPFAPWNGIR